MKNKIKKIIIGISCFCFLTNIVLAEKITGYQNLTEVFIKYEQLGWQTYEFYVLTNLEDESSLTYEWNIDNQETFSAPRLRFFFEQGDHVIKVKVEDKYGNTRYDLSLIHI